MNEQEITEITKLLTKSLKDKGWNRGRFGEYYCNVMHTEDFGNKSYNLVISKNTEFAKRSLLINKDDGKLTARVSYVYGKEHIYHHKESHLAVPNSIEDSLRWTNEVIEEMQQKKRG